MPQKPSGMLAVSFREGCACENRSTNATSANFSRIFYESEQAAGHPILDGYLCIGSFIAEDLSHVMAAHNPQRIVLPHKPDWPKSRAINQAGGGWKQLMAQSLPALPMVSSSGHWRSLRWRVRREIPISSARLGAIALGVHQSLAQKVLFIFFH